MFQLPPPTVHSPRESATLMLNGCLTLSLPRALSLSPLYFSHFHIPPPKQVYGNGRGVIERCFIRGDLNVFLCVRQESGWWWWGEGGRMGAIWGLFRQGDLVASLNVQPRTRSRLASLFKMANFGDPRGGGVKCAILKGCAPKRLD